LDKLKGGRNAPIKKEKKMIVQIIAFAIFVIFFWEMFKKVVNEWKL
jgi:F0F1-type ATP synthase membrane subunit b/b'